MLNQYNHTNIIIQNHHQHSSEITTYQKTINYIIDLIEEKISPFSNNLRSKRGLINGLGMLIKQITGNMDSEDSKKITSMLSSLKNNQDKVINQINNQYSINNEIMLEFNKTVSVIDQNEKLFFSRLQLMGKLLNKSDNMMEQIHTKDILSQFIHLFEIVLNILQDIENSLTFCNLKIVHPSIISNRELLKELLKISKYFPNMLPFQATIDNIHKFKKLIIPKCVTHEKEIIYFLTLPMFNTINYEIYRFLSIPNINFETIIPNSQFILSHNSELVPLKDICNNIQNQYFCSHHLVQYFNTTCEQSILMSKPASCQKVQLFPQQSLEYLEEINKFLGIFPQHIRFRQNCKSGYKENLIKGIFLIENKEDCTLFIAEQQLVFNDTSTGKPILLDSEIPIAQSPSQDLPKLRLHHLQVSELSKNLQQIEKSQKPDRWHMSTALLLYTCIAVVLISLIYKISKKRCKNNTSIPDDQRSNFKPDDAKI